MLVACGYSQIPGVDFSENYSPFIHDITFRILLLVMMVLFLSAKIVDVEPAFLYGDLEEEILMDRPPGMFDAKPDESLLLGHCIYGLVQAARQYHKKMMEILQGIGFVGGIIYPCIFVRKHWKV